MLKGFQDRKNGQSRDDMSDFIPDFNMASEKIQSPVRYPSDLIDEEWEILEPILDWVSSQFECVLEVVRRQKGVQGFHILPRRWVVERTFAWLIRSRRLSKDYERKPTSSEAQVYLASSRLLLRQICNNQTQCKLTAD